MLEGLARAVAPGLAALQAMVTGASALRVGRVSDEVQLVEVVEFRHAAYKRHYPDQTVPDVAEDIDTAPATSLLTVRDRAGALVAVMRVRHGLAGRQAGLFCAAVWPEGAADGAIPFVAVERYSSAGPRVQRLLARLLLLATVKAICERYGIETISIFAVPALVPIYEAYGLRVVRDADGKPVWMPSGPLTHYRDQMRLRCQVNACGTAPHHRVMARQLVRGRDLDALVPENLKSRRLNHA